METVSIYDYPPRDCVGKKYSFSHRIFESCLATLSELPRTYDNTTNAKLISDPLDNTCVSQIIREQDGTYTYVQLCIETNSQVNCCNINHLTHKYHNFEGMDIELMYGSHRVNWTNYW